MPIFERTHVLAGSPEDVVAAVAAVALVALVRSIVSRRRARPDPDAYDVELAWRRAGAYGLVVLVAAWAAGVLSSLARGPFVDDLTGRATTFTLATLGAVVVVTVGYWVIWARGTFHLDRPRSVATIVVFGGGWGIAEGLLMLSLFAAAEWTGLGRGLSAVLAFVAASAFQGVWHAKYWDIRVAPDHNIIEWNPRKVAFAHTPNLLVTFGHLVLFGAPWVAVGLQVIALTASVTFMRFPPWSTRHTAHLEPHGATS